MTYKRWITLLVASALAVALTLTSSAQQGPTAPGVIRINVNLVQVDAVVKDSKGKPVTDLKAEDFELFQDGQLQKISNVEFISVRNPGPVTPAPQVKTQPRNGPPPPAPSRVLKREEINRTIALVIDDLGLSFDSVVRVRESLKKWVDTQMQPGDLAAVVRTSAGMGSFQRFTTDKKMLHAAIDLIQFHLGRVGVSSFKPVSGIMPTDGIIDTSVFDDEWQHAYLVASLNAIQHVVGGLRDFPGRKSLILFSESMRFAFREPGMVATYQTTNATDEARLRKLTDEANRSSVVIYAIDPRGVVYTGLTAEDSGNVADTATLAAVGGDRTQELIASRDGMNELPYRTGGLFVHDSNDVGDMLRQAVDDGDGYYLIGYQPEGATFDGNSGNPAFHKISLRVKRPGLTVRSRTGFYGTPDNRVVPDDQTRRVQFANALVSPFASGDVRVRLTGLYLPSETEGADIQAFLHFDANDLMFMEEADGARTAEVDIATVTFDADGEQVATNGETTKIRVLPEKYPDLLKKGFVYLTKVHVKKAGGYEVRVVLRDKASQRLGSARQFVDVPDVKNGRLAMSGIAVFSGPSPAAASGPSGAATADTQSPYGTPARRVFNTGSTVGYSYQILNARTNDEKKPQLESQIRLFRDGEQVYQGKLFDLLTETKVANPKRLSVTSSLRLNTLPPGNYVMQIVVADTLRNDKYRMTAQAIDFEVR